MKTIILTQILILFTTGLFAQNCLVAAYDFDNSSMNDALGVKHATALGTSFGTDHIGASNSALEIGGAGSGQMAFVNHSIVNTQNDFSVSFWVNIDVMNSGYIITSRFDSLGAEQGGLDIVLNSNGEVSCKLRTISSSSLVEVKSSVLLPNTWYHVVAVKEGNNMKLYVDNALSASAAISAGTLTFPNFWAFGAGRNLSQNVIVELDGKIDEIRFYCKALSTTEISNLSGQSCEVAAYLFDNSSMNDSWGVKHATSGGNSFGIDHLGNSNAALNIDGAGSGQLAFVNNPIINTQNDFSVSFWVNIDVMNSGYIITSRFDSLGAEQGGLDIVLNSNGEVSCKLRTISSSSLVEVKSSVLLPNTWYHVVAVKEGNNMKLYVDNALSASAAISAGTLTFPNFWAFGAGRNLSQNVIVELDGKIDEIRFYCKALNATDINAVYLPVQPIHKTATAQVNIYPNPVRNLLTIESETNSSSYFIQIMNSTGQVLQSYQSNSNSNQLDVSQLPTGIYFVQLSDESNHLVTRKFVKE